jgi:phosphoglycolate phosphatase
MRIYNYVIFDIDGTILDTTEGVVNSVCYTIQYYNLPMYSNNTLKSFVGPPMQESFKKVYNFSPEKAQEAAGVFREHYKDADVLRAKPYPGILNLFNELKQRQYKIGIATYKRTDYAIKILKHFSFSPFCNAIYGSDQENKLSKAEIIKLCIDDVKVEKSKTVLLGDSEYDAIGAEQAGIDFIGVTYGFGFKTKEDVNNYKNIGSVDTVDELRKLLLL